MLEYCDGIHHASRLWFVNHFLAHMLLLTNTFDTPQTLMSVQHVPCTSSVLHEPSETSTPNGRLPLHTPKQPHMSVQYVPCTSSALHEPLETSAPGSRLPLHASKQPCLLERHDFGHCGLTWEHIYANW